MKRRFAGDRRRRIAKQLAAEHTVLCQACGWTFNTLHWATCPACAIAHDGDRYDDVSPEAETVREKLRASR